jgi:hypothetical protein
VNHLTNYLRLTTLMSNTIDFPGGKLTNSNSCGSYGQPTTSRVFNSAGDGRGYPVTYNQETLSCWGRTTRHLSIGLQLSSRKSMQAKMASSAWWHVGPPREFSNVPLQKFPPFHVRMVIYSVMFSGWQYVHAMGQIFVLIFYNNSFLNCYVKFHWHWSPVIA